MWDLSCKSCDKVIFGTDAEMRMRVGRGCVRRAAVFEMAARSFVSAPSVVVGQEIQISTVRILHC